MSPVQVTHTYKRTHCTACTHTHAHTYTHMRHTYTHCKFHGDFICVQGVPIFIIGHHILYGKCQQLEKPIAVLAKTTQSHDIEDGHEDDITDDTRNDTTNPHYIVKAIVKKKVLFKTRPKPIIANVPKRL